MARYRGMDDLVTTDQVVKYIVDNYLDEDGQVLKESWVRGVCEHEEAWEWIQNGVANRSYVYYIGDIIAERAGYNDRYADDDSEFEFDDEDKDSEDTDEV